MISSVYVWFSVYLNDVLIVFFMRKRLTSWIRVFVQNWRNFPRLQNIDVHGLNDVLIFI